MNPAPLRSVSCGETLLCKQMNLYMVRNILIPLDLSEKNEAALQAVRDLADPATARLTLLHVVETLKDVPFEEMEDFYQELSEQAEERLATWSAALAADGYDVTVEVVYGERSRAIVRAAIERAAELIVVRSHVMDRDHPAESFGTLSHRVALLAPCSVLLVR